MKAFFSRRARPAAAPAGIAHELALALHTDVGPVRTLNEDCIAALNAPGGAAEGGDRTVLVALADGMGGHQAGDVASRLAVQAALQSYGAQPVGTSLQAALHAALRAANSAVHGHARQHAECEGMGTTMLLVAPTPRGLGVAWVGDSRLYRWRDGSLVQLTRDDTLVRSLVDRGLVDPADAHRHPDHSVLTQAVGTHAAIPSPHVEGPMPIAVGDRYLLCSDGIHDVLDDADLARLLATGTPHQTAQAIAAAAWRLGTSDNLSIGVLHMLPPAAPAAARRTRHGEEVLS